MKCATCGHEVPFLHTQTGGWRPDMPTRYFCNKRCFGLWQSKHQPEPKGCFIYDTDQFREVL